MTPILISVLMALLSTAATVHAGTRADPVVVETAQGTLRGSTGDSGIHRFLGIPYAAPPVGERRWRPPAPPAEWNEVFDASAFGPVCPQPDTWPGVSDHPQSEDCLTLNVWTPDLEPDERLPVMVWIHGGSFKGGTGRWLKTEGSRLAARGVVVVTLNYRLGHLGNFAHPALSALHKGEPLANYGLMDQIAALQWVQRNIAGFGGDAGNVTIFGYSAGAVSVNFLMATPASDGLFRRAIAQSSAVLIPRSAHMREDRPGTPALEKEGVALARSFGIPAEGDDGAEAVAAQLRALSLEQVMSARLPQGSLNPVVDGVLVREDLATSFASGRIHRVDYLAGVDDYEASLAEVLRRVPERLMLPLLAEPFGFDPETVRRFYGPQRPWLTVLDEFFADNFHASTYYLAAQTGRQGLRTWLYWFEYLPPAATPGLPGVPHGGEVPYVFGNLEHRDRVGNPPVTDQDRFVSGQVMSYWTNFARTGNPNGEGLPGWQPFDAGRAWWLRIGEQTGSERDLLAERIRFWMRHYQQQGTQSDP